MSHTVDSTIHINEGNTLVWEGLSDENKTHSDATRWLNNATITAQIKDREGTVVIANIALSYIASSNGVYRGTITKAQVATLIDGNKYFVEMTAVVTGFEDGFRRFEVRARYHGRQ
jgi:hypothetical protein